MTTTQEIALPSQEWFDSHYNWAANIVGTWIKEEIDIKSATILDFGCGDGVTGLGVADNFSPKMVVGVDIRDSFKNISHIAQRMAPTQALPSNISFLQIDPSERLADKVKANAVFSWSCFEHIERQHLTTIFQDIYDMLPTGGLFFLQIEPLYFSPYGSHLAAYVEQPWQHLLISEEELRQLVQDATPPDGIKGTRNSAVPLQQRKSFHLRQYTTLNKLTADEVLKIGTDIGFTVKKEMRSKVDLEPPATLIEQYGLDTLLTNETRVLFKKPNPCPADSFALKAKRLVVRAMKSLRLH
jgi:2-polyprenyl-3-methyl-5-hydroxy-6-metoxy-1,4-benzoquinol methylase